MFCNPLFITNFGDIYPDDLMDILIGIIKIKYNVDVTIKKRIITNDGLIIFTQNRTEFLYFVKIGGEKLYDKKIFILPMLNKPKVKDFVIYAINNLIRQSQLYNKRTRTLDLRSLYNRFAEIGVHPEIVDFYSISFVHLLFYRIGKESIINKLTIECIDLTYNNITSFRNWEPCMNYVENLQFLRVDNTCFEGTYSEIGNVKVLGPG